MSKKVVMTDREIRVRMQDLVKRARDINDRECKSTTEFDIQMKDHMDILKEIGDFSAAQGEGLKIGKLCSWPVADGQALYFVWKIGKETCEMEWIPGIDAWQSEVVQNGKALRDAVDRCVRGRDAIKKMFAGKTPKQVCESS